MTELDRAANRVREEINAALCSKSTNVPHDLKR